MRSISETEADEPSRGRRIFQQKNICDRGAKANTWSSARPERDWREVWRKDFSVEVGIGSLPTKFLNVTLRRIELRFRA